jgi:hypothetical protein
VGFAIRKSVLVPGVVSLDEDSLANLADRLLGVVRKDPSKLDSILEKHVDMRGELEPILATAVRVESVKHPAISEDVRSRFKHKLLASSDI